MKLSKIIDVLKTIEETYGDQEYYLCFNENIIKNSQMEIVFLDDDGDGSVTRKLRECEEKFIVRLYDGFDNEWMDISKPVSKEEADKIWRENTKNGTKNTKYADIDYYSVFPADTKMMWSAERNDERRKK